MFFEPTEELSMEMCKSLITEDMDDLEKLVVAIYASEYLKIIKHGVETIGYERFIKVNEAIMEYVNKGNLLLKEIYGHNPH